MMVVGFESGFEKVSEKILERFLGSESGIGFGKGGHGRNVTGNALGSNPEERVFYLCFWMR